MPCNLLDVAQITQEHQHTPIPSRRAAGTPHQDLKNASKIGSLAHWLIGTFFSSFCFFYAPPPARLFLSAQVHHLATSKPNAAEKGSHRTGRSMETGSLAGAAHLKAATLSCKLYALKTDKKHKSQLLHLLHFCCFKRGSWPSALHMPHIKRHCSMEKMKSPSPRTTCLEKPSSLTLVSLRGKWSFTLRTAARAAPSIA